MHTVHNNKWSTRIKQVSLDSDIQVGEIGFLRHKFECIYTPELTVYTTYTYEIDTDGAYVRVGVGVVGKPQQQA